MDTALVTGKLEIQFVPEKKVEKDVEKGNTSCFSEILNTSLKNKDVNENPESSKIFESEEKDFQLENKDVDIKQDNEIQIDEENENVENDGKLKRKGKNIKAEVELTQVDFENGLNKLMNSNDIQEVKIEDVEKDVVKIEDVEIKVDNYIENLKNEGKIEIKVEENTDINPEEKLENLLSKLDVEPNKNVKIKDESENVIEVGPQSVETEKIELNTEEDNQNIKVESLGDNVDEKKVFLDANEKNKDVNLENDSSLKKVLNQDSNKEIVNQDKVKEVNTEDADPKDVDILDKDVSNKEESVSEKITYSEEDELSIFEQKYFNQNVNKQQNGTSQENSGEKESFYDKKEDKYKMKDFRSNKDLDFSQRMIKETDVKLENKFDIKEVSNINKFENMDVNQKDILEQVTEKLEVSLFDDKSEMVIKLKPNDLGKVTVKITIENGVMNAKFLADSTKVKEALESNLNNLKESLKDQGLNVQDLSVSVDSGRSQNQTFEQNNLVYFNNNKKDYENDRMVSYEDTYYEVQNNEKNINNYWMDSTVSFLA